jgi:hypothetical protein
MAQTITKIAAIFNKKTSSNLWPNGAETDQTNSTDGTACWIRWTAGWIGAGIFIKLT